MADSVNTRISEKGHQPDKSEATGAGHCACCSNHGDRLKAVEAKLGMKPQPGAAKEETGRSLSKKPSYERARP